MGSIDEVVQVSPDTFWACSFRLGYYTFPIPQLMMAMMLSSVLTLKSLLCAIFSPALPSLSPFSTVGLGTRDFTS